MLNWNQYLIIADKFQHKVPYSEREDFKQDVIVRLAEIDTRGNGSGPLSILGMYRTASFVVKESLKRMSFQEVKNTDPKVEKEWVMLVSSLK